MRTFTIKIKTAECTRIQTGIFLSSWAAMDAALDMLGDAQGNVTVQVRP